MPIHNEVRFMSLNFPIWIKNSFIIRNNPIKKKPSENLTICQLSIKNIFIKIIRVEQMRLIFHIGISTEHASVIVSRFEILKGTHIESRNVKFHLQTEKWVWQSAVQANVRWIYVFLTYKSFINLNRI